MGFDVGVGPSKSFRIQEKGRARANVEATNKRYPADCRNGNDRGRWREGAGHSLILCMGQRLKRWGMATESGYGTPARMTIVVHCNSELVPGRR